MCGFPITNSWITVFFESINYILMSLLWEVLAVLYAGKSCPLALKGLLRLGIMMKRDLRLIRRQGKLVTDAGDTKCQYLWLVLIASFGRIGRNNHTQMVFQLGLLWPEVWARSWKLTRRNMWGETWSSIISHATWQKPSRASGRERSFPIAVEVG